MLTALQPITEYLDQLLTLTHPFTQSVQARATTQTLTVSRLWLKLSFAPVNIILAVLEDDPEPIGTDESTRYADHEWLLQAMPAIESECTDEPVNVIDLAKARERRQLIVERQKRYEYTKGQHLHPRQQAVVEALLSKDFVYCGVFDDEDFDRYRQEKAGEFWVSEEYSNGYWIAVQHQKTLDVWGIDIDDEEQAEKVTVEITINLINQTIVEWDTKDQLPLPQPEPPTVPADLIPPIPEDAFTLVAAKGKFAIKQIDGGHLIGRWVTQKAGLKFSRYFIPDDGNCDCKASKAGKNCCHQKALDHYQSRERDRELMEQRREQERLKMLEKNRYELVVWRGENESRRNFERDIYGAQFHWDRAKADPLVTRTVIEDRLLNKPIATWQRPMIAAS